KVYCAIKSERGTDLELEGLLVIAILGVERAAERQLQRAQRRLPRQADTGRITPSARIFHVILRTAIVAVLLVFRGDLAGVREQEPAQRTIARCARERQVQLHIAHEAARTAQVVAAVRIARAERS